MEDQRRHTSQSECPKAWSESRGKHRIALDGEGWYDVRHGRLIITPDGTAEEETNEYIMHVCAYTCVCVCMHTCMCDVYICIMFPCAFVHACLHAVYVHVQV